MCESQYAIWPEKPKPAKNLVKLMQNARSLVKIMQKKARKFLFDVSTQGDNFPTSTQQVQAQVSKEFGGEKVENQLINQLNQ